MIMHALFVFFHQNQINVTLSKKSKITLCVALANQYCDNVMYAMKNIHLAPSHCPVQAPLKDKSKHPICVPFPDVPVVPPICTVASSRLVTFRGGHIQFDGVIDVSTLRSLCASHLSKEMVT